MQEDEPVHIFNVDDEKGQPAQTTTPTSFSSQLIEDVISSVMTALKPILEAGFTSISQTVVDVGQMVTQNTVALQQYMERFNQIIAEDRDAHQRYADAFDQLKKDSFSAENQKKFLAFLKKLQDEISELKLKSTQLDQQMIIHQDQEDLQKQIHDLQMQNAALKKENEALKAHSITPEEKSTLFSERAVLKEANAKSV